MVLILTIALLNNNSFCRWGHWDLGRKGNLPRVIQMVKYRTWTWYQSPTAHAHTSILLCFLSLAFSSWALWCNRPRANWVTLDLHWWVCKCEWWGQFAKLGRLTGGTSCTDRVCSVRLWEAFSIFLFWIPLPQNWLQKSWFCVRAQCECQMSELCRDSQRGLGESMWAVGEHPFLPSSWISFAT